MEQQSNNAAKTISVVMLVTLLGKVMGLYRDRLLAIHYSVGVEANAFFTASRIPRVFFDAVFASAIAACFIPVFSEFLEKKGRKEAFRFAGNFITVMALLTGALTLIGMLFPQALVACLPTMPTRPPPPWPPLSPGSCSPRCSSPGWPSPWWAFYRPRTGSPPRR